MPTTTTASPQNKVTFTKYNRSNNLFMLFLAIVFAGVASIWLAVEWFSHQPNNQLWQSWLAITDKISELASNLTDHTPVAQPAVKEQAVLNSKQEDTDLLATPSISSNNIKIWRQTMQSIESLNKQAATSGAQPSYHNRLGILYSQAGDFASALKQFNQAIVLCRKQIWQKTSQSKSSDLSSIYVELTCAHSNLARIYDRLGDHDRVIAELEELNADITFAGDNPSHHQVVQTNVVQTNIASTSNTNTSSTTIPVVRHYQLTAEEAALLAKAEALRQVGNLADAMQEYRNLINLNPNLAIAHQRLGLAAISNKDTWLAMNELQIAATLDDTDPDTYNDLGMVYLQLGDSLAAKQAFGQAHRIDPQHLSAAMNFADSLSATGSMGIALHVMQQATLGHPMSPAAHNNLAALYARTGNDKAAAKEFAQTISLNSAMGDAHYGLGVALLNLKCYPEAIKELEIAQKLDPGILDLQNKLDLANSCNNMHTIASAQSVDY